MTMLDDDRIDQRLRRAGERLRHEAPGTSTVEAALVDLDDRPIERGRRRWVTPVAIGAVVAAAVALFTLVVRQEEAVERLPADPPPRPIVDVRFYEEDFDGDGGQCVEVLLEDPEVDAARGCMTGAQVRSGRPMVTSVEGGTLAMVASGTRVNAVGTAVVGGCLDALIGATRFLDAVTCGEQPLFGVLPATPDGDVRWTVQNAEGRSVELAPITVDGDILVFDVPGAPARPCLVIASPLDGGDWVDACSPLPTVRALTRVGGAPAVVGPLANSVEVLDRAAAAATFGCKNLDGLLEAVEPAGGVTIRLSCADDLAIVVQGSAALETGRTGPYPFLLEHRASGPWTVVAEGPSLPCAPVRFCQAFGPAEDLADAAAPIPRP